MTDIHEDRMLCEGNHEIFPPAVMSMVLSDSQSAANIVFMCRACTVEFVIETLDDADVTAYELRKL